MRGGERYQQHNGTIRDINHVGVQVNIEACTGHSPPPGRAVSPEKDDGRASNDKGCDHDNGRNHDDPCDNGQARDYYDAYDDDHAGIDGLHSED